MDDAPAIQPAELPLGERIVRPGTFGGLVSLLAGVIDHSESALDAIGSAAGGGDVPDLDAAYAVSVGAAVSAHAGHVAAAGISPAASLIVAGDDVEGLRQSVIPYLPPPDTEIPSQVDPPPPPPGPNTPRENPPPALDMATGCPAGWIADGEQCINPDDPNDVIRREPVA